MGAVVGAVAREIARAKSAGDPIIFVCDAHLDGDPEFALFPPHALPGKGRQIVAGLDTAGAVVKDAVVSFDLEAHGNALRELERTLGAKIL